MKAIWYFLSAVSCGVSLVIMWTTNSEQSTFFFAAAVMFQLFAFGKELKEARTVKIEKVVTDVHLDQGAFIQLFANAVTKVAEIAAEFKKSAKVKKEKPIRGAHGK